MVVLHLLKQQEQELHQQQVAMCMTRILILLCDYYQASQTVIDVLPVRETMVSPTLTSTNTLGGNDLPLARTTSPPIQQALMSFLT